MVVFLAYPGSEDTGSGRAPRWTYAMVPARVVVYLSRKPSTGNGHVCAWILILALFDMRLQGYRAIHDRIWGKLRLSFIMGARSQCVAIHRSLLCYIIKVPLLLCALHVKCPWSGVLYTICKVFLLSVVLYNMQSVLIITAVYAKCPYHAVL